MTRRRVMSRGFLCAAVPLALAATAWAQTTQPAARGADEFRPIVRADSSGGGQSAAPRSAAPTWDATKVALSLGAVLGLVVLLRWSVKRLFPGQIGIRSSRAVEVLARSTLSPRQQFLLLRVGRRLVVVADSGGQMNSVCEITDADEIAEILGQVNSRPSDTIGRSFMTLFGRSRQTFEEKPTGVDDSSEDAEGMTRQEIGGLMEKVRLLSGQFKR